MSVTPGEQANPFLLFFSTIFYGRLDGQVEFHPLNYELFFFVSATYTPVSFAFVVLLGHYVNLPNRTVNIYNRTLDL